MILILLNLGFDVIDAIVQEGPAKTGQHQGGQHWPHDWGAAGKKRKIQMDEPLANKKAEMSHWQTRQAIDGFMGHGVGGATRRGSLGKNTSC